jgi:hypothetical protein
VRPPLVVQASLGAIGCVGATFALTSTIGGSAPAALLFASVACSAYACLHLWRWSRTALFICSLASMAPLIVGVTLTWPQVSGGLPYLLGVAGVFGGLAGMLSRSAREWHASAKAHRLIGL